MSFTTDIICLLAIGINFILFLTIHSLYAAVVTAIWSVGWILIFTLINVEGNVEEL